MGSAPPLKVAIVGGGLCGIALAISLKARNIPFTIYESRGAFTEIGAGINFAPNGLKALRLIDDSIAEKIYTISTRNAPPHEDTWLLFKYGAPSGSHGDAETFLEMKAPPTGIMAMHRQELLRALADHMGEEHARFNKKLASYEQNDDHVKLKFADGTEDAASVLVGCDGIHSSVRAAMFGKESLFSKPHYNHDGAYRAVIPIEKAVEAWGQSARQGQVLLGPNGYLIYYPVNSGTAVNVGFWQGKTEDWKRDEWIVPDQGESFNKDRRAWGEYANKILDLFDPSPAFWAQHTHLHQPGSFVDGRVILIGDGAHSMPPHQGNGSSQAAEDAYILGETLTLLHDSDHSLKSVNAILKAAEQVRKPRFSQAHENSIHAGPHWYSLCKQRLEGAELEEWIEGVKGRLEWIWHPDLIADAEKAKDIAKQMMSSAPI